MAHPPVECADVREAISALADDEHSALSGEAIDGHLSSCPACTAFRSSVESQRRSLAVGSAPNMPDLGPRVAAVAASSERHRGWNWPRLALVLVGLSVVGLSVPGLFLGEDGMAPSHEARHLGAFSMAYGIALLVIAYRPSRARAFLIVTMLLALSLVITAVFDVAQGTIPLGGEVIHVPEILSLLLVWFLARQQPAMDPRYDDLAPPGGPLRVVGSGEPD